MPDVSVVLTTRDRWGVLKSMGLRGAMIQEDIDSEIIVVDDASIDGTADHLRELTDDRITLLDGGGRGPSHARNVGLAAARSEFVAFLDDDDAWSPRKLREQLNVANDSAADFVYSPAVIIDEHLTPVAIAPAPRPERLYESLLVRNVIAAGGSNVLVRTAAIRNLGGFDEALYVHEDWDLFLKLARDNQPAVCDDLLIAYLVYRRLPANRFGRDPADEFRRIGQRFTEIVMGPRHAEITASRWRAFEQRRAGQRLLAAQEYLQSAWTHKSLSNGVRAAAVLVGEPLIRLGGRRSLRRPAAPEWLDHYR